MKTLKMKQTLLTAIAIIFSVTILTIPISAQEEEKKTVTIKTTKIVNGEKIETDTTFEISNLEDLEKYENLELLIDDEMIKDLDITLEELDGLKDINMKVMVTSDSLHDLTERIMVMTKVLEGMEGDLGGQMKNIEVIVEMTDSISGERTVTINTESGGENVFVVSGEDMDDMKWTEDGKGKVVFVKTSMGEGDNEEIEIDIKGDGEIVYVIDGEDMDDMKWAEDGKRKVVIVKSSAGDNEDFDIVINGDEDMVLYKVNCEGSGDGEQEIFVDIIETKDGKGTTIKSKIIICTLNEKDIDKLNDAGVALDPKASKEDRLELNNLKFYPNPNSGKFILKFKTSENEKTGIKIYDMNGKEVYNESVKGKDGVYEKEIDISSEQKGTYFLKISQGGKVSTKKIILE